MSGFRLSSAWGRFVRDERGDLLSRVAGGAAVIAVFSVGAAHYLSERFEQEKKVLAALASGAPNTRERIVTFRGVEADPITTGSIRSLANDTRFDPCAVTPRR